MILRPRRRLRGLGERREARGPGGMTSLLILQESLVLLARKGGVEWGTRVGPVHARGGLSVHYRQIFECCVILHGLFGSRTRSSPVTRCRVDFSVTSSCRGSAALRAEQRFYDGCVSVCRLSERQRVVRGGAEELLGRTTSRHAGQIQARCPERDPAPGCRGPRRPRTARRSRIPPRPVHRRMAGGSCWARTAGSPPTRWPHRDFCAGRRSPPADPGGPARCSFRLRISRICPWPRARAASCTSSAAVPSSGTTARPSTW